jgi:hypothetical protein
MTMVMTATMCCHHFRMRLSTMEVKARVGQDPSLHPPGRQSEGPTP